MYNQNYERAHGNDPYIAFQYPNPGSFNFPPPPMGSIPNSFPSANRTPLSDVEYIAQWERKIKNRAEPKKKTKLISISEAREKMQRLVSLIKDVKTKEKKVTERVNSMDESEWNESFGEINRMRADIHKMMSQVNDEYLKELRRSLSKRESKRTRLKRLKLRKAEEKRQMLKEREEKARKIDENLQKMKDELEKRKRAEDEKLEADIFLREVYRKKHDAKKCIGKLEALMRLRQARFKSARGRGEHASEPEANTFNKNIERLIAMWKGKLTSYEKEEMELRLKLKKTPAEDVHLSKSEDDVMQTIAAWKEAMFGSATAMPQRDFHGDMAAFIAVRCKWDSYLNDDGTPIPIGWVLPQERTKTD